MNRTEGGWLGVSWDGAPPGSLWMLCDGKQLGLGVLLERVEAVSSSAITDDGELPLEQCVDEQCAGAAEGECGNSTEECVAAHQPVEQTQRGNTAEECVTAQQLVEQTQNCTRGSGHLEFATPMGLRKHQSRCAADGPALPKRENDVPINIEPKSIQASKSAADIKSVADMPTDVVRAAVVKQHSNDASNTVASHKVLNHPWKALRRPDDALHGLGLACQVTDVHRPSTQLSMLM